MFRSSRLLSFPLAFIAIPALACLALAQAPPKSPTRPPSSTASATAAAHDLSGVWTAKRPPATALQSWVYEFSPQEPPMTAWGEAQYKAAKPSFGPHSYPIAETNDPVYHGCFPPGTPRIFLHPFPMQIIQSPGQVTMLFEYDSMRRIIYTDGSPHRDGLPPTWMGDSIGHWEGDTLVVDTTNFNDKTWLDRIGHPHSDQLHLIERIRRTDPNTLQDDITIEDPKAYTKPWTAHLYFRSQPSWKLIEQFCEDNDSFASFEKQETSQNQQAPSH